MPPSFTTPKTLSDYLKTRIPQEAFSSWGTRPGTKNIHNLFQELTSGETSLNDAQNPPLRTVNVVVVNIKDGKNRILIESRQELSNGDVRVRSRPLSEKMKLGESVEDAAVRAVKEELGKEGECVRVVKETCRSRVEEKGRSRPLSEKMKLGESVEDAAVRAVKEELGKEGECVRVVKETCRESCGGKGVSFLSRAASVLCVA
ncbi:NUDIX hydrolase domain-like protein [Artemisia annua]|uniref:NUDIX hydrolase domain-like protein n=1 Tax=Artemisia annua TaxID=35608 RepID=A0A2U1NJ96_ARTAN|nr:NUDIX hydrolase domain-like protein [Artemisia annua]